MKLAVNVNLSEHDLRDAVVHASQDDALDFMLAIDLAIADAGFTEALIRRLAASLRGDLDDKDFDALIADLAKPNAGGKPPNEVRSA